MNAYHIVENVTSRAAQIRADEMPPRQRFAWSVKVQTLQLVAALSKPGACLAYSAKRNRWVVEGVGFHPQTVRALERQGRLRGCGVLLTLA